MINNTKHIEKTESLEREILDENLTSKFIVFNEKMKMAELLLVNNRLMFVLPRFGIEFGFGEKSVAEVCSEHDISVQLFLLICNVYTHSTFLPSEDSLHSFDLSDLLVYLHNSHNDYLKTLIPSLKRKVMLVANGCGAKGLVLRRFFDEYINEVMKHFSYEEKTVFPYIEKLLTEGKQKGFNIAVYEKNHTDIEDKLTELKNILIKYVPQVSLAEQREALLDLFLFEDDLDHHSLIENRIVVPLVSEIEKTRK